MIVYFLLTIAFFIIAVFIVVFFKDVIPLMYHGAVWQPSETRAIRKILEMAEVKPDEQVYDLGSGDGRVLITAAKEFGAQATGIEINPFLVLYSRLRIFIGGLREKARAIRGDMFQADIGSADVLILFQREETNERLKEKLMREMKKGTRLICYVWKMKGWEPAKVDADSQIYVYRM